MPIYEYACQACQAHEEILQKFGEEAPLVCPKCGAKNSLSKVVSSSAFHLKGGGWYKDLYASKKTGTESSAKTEKKDTKKSEEKP